MDEIDITEEIIIPMEDTQIYEPKVDMKADRMLIIPCQRPLVITLFLLGFICPLCFLVNRLLFHITNNLFVYNLSRTSCAICGFICIFLFIAFTIRFSL